MRPLNVKFASSDLKVITVLHTGLASWSNLTVARKLPAIGDMTRRMITIRNDSGPVEGVQSRRRYGINGWADSSLDAENLLLDAMAILQVCADGNPITLTDQFSGPYEIDEETPYVVGGKPLYHFYATCRISVRGQ